MGKLQGGRNLILNSPEILMSGSDGGNNRNVAEFKDGHVSIVPIATGNVYLNPTIPTSLPMEKGKTYTLSFQVSTHGPTGLYWYPSEKYVKSAYIPDTKGKWADVSFTYTQTDDTTANPSLWGFYGLQPGKEVRYTPPKLEMGSTATPWTPAPEDLGLEYPDHVTHFGTYFKNEDMISNELVEFPEELRGSRNLISEGNDLTKYYTSGYQNANFDIKPIDMSSEWGFSEAYRITTSGGDNNIKTVWSSSNRMSMEFGKDYTWSAHVKNLGDTTVHLNMNGLTGASSVILPPGFSGRVYRTGVRRENYNWFQVLPRTINVVDSIDIVLARFKVTEGKAEDAWTPSPEDLGLVYPDHITHFGTYFKESNVLGYDLIGGRNLIPNSHQEKTSSREYVLYDNLTPIFDKYGLGEYTFSFDVKSAIAGLINVYYSDRVTSQIKYGWRGGGNVNATTEYQRFSFTVDVFELTPDANQSSLAFYGTYDSGRIPSIKNVKIERGPVATPWTPAPEDLGLEYPPSVTYFDKNPVVSSAVTNELVEFDKDSKGFDLRNKTGPLSGEEIYTDKADNSVVHVEIDGKSCQNAGSGKNLLTNDFNYWEIGSVNGTPNSGVDYTQTQTLRSPYIELKKGSYTLSISNNIGDYSVVENWIHTYDSNKKGIEASGWNSALSRRLEIPEDGCFIRVLIRPNPRIEVSLSDVGSMFNIQLEEGSTATDYELPTPTPDYPIEIHSLNDFDVVSSIGGRNCLKRSDLSSHAEILADGGVFDFSRDSKGTIALFSNLKLEKGTYIYHIMMKKPAGDAVASIRFHRNNTTISYYGKNQEVNGEWNRIEIPFEVTDNSEVYGSQIYNHAFGTDFAKTVEVMHPMIEKGNIVTDWTPALEDITESDNHPLIDKINLLLDEPLRSVGDVKDRLFRDSDGIWKVERKFIKYQADGSENWSYNSIYERFDMSMSIGANTGSIYNGMNSHFISKGASNNDKGNVTWVFNGIPRVIHHGVSSSAELKSYMKNQYDKKTPVTWIMEMVTPTIETLDQELQDKLNSLKSFKDSNYIYTINNTEGMPEDVNPMIHATFKSENYGELAKDGLVYPDNITHLTTQVKYGTMVVSELIEGGGAYGNSTTRV